MFISGQLQYLCPSIFIEDTSSLFMPTLASSSNTANGLSWTRSLSQRPGNPRVPLLFPNPTHQLVSRIYPESLHSFPHLHHHYSPAWFSFLVRKLFVLLLGGTAVTMLGQRSPAQEPSGTLRELGLVVCCLKTAFVRGSSHTFLGCVSGSGTDAIYELSTFLRRYRPPWPNCLLT